MQPVFLSDIELYYSELVNGNSIEVSGEEFHHIKDVMRHKVGDDIFLTDGKGVIYKSQINLIGKNSLTANVLSSHVYTNPLSNITFCVPRLKSADRFEFALEKCVELGITNFIVFDSQRTVAKGEKLERWQKILTSAMKQSLRTWLPNVVYCKSISEINKMEGIKILFDQKAGDTLQNYLVSNHQSPITNLFFLFGPEGGFSEDEFEIANGELKIKLTENRLRSETAIVVAASFLATSLVQ